ncbi:hypothetical protein QBC45DRAFT_412033 [Copromyces sp. CBS 386.78]|nr:hypothetical protein QBC45DRAFT_412033 [Copromyces sp. CBS 386.78]
MSDARCLSVGLYTVSLPCVAVFCAVCAFRNMAKRKSENVMGKIKKKYSNRCDVNLTCRPDVPLLLSVLQLWKVIPRHLHDVPKSPINGETVAEFSEVAYP